MSPPPLPSPEALRARLEDLAQARGFLLPHHGALAAFAPDLHEAYLRMYQALTLTERHLSPLEKETVWLGILVAVREEVGTHHLELFARAGGSPEAARTLVAMAGFAAGHDALAFAQAHWADRMPGLDAAAAYAEGLARLRGAALPEATAELAMLAVQAARGSAGGTAHHLRRAYALGIGEERMAEALSYLIWPAGVNCFLEACTTWHGMMRAGELTPSPRFAAWAGMPGMGAYDTRAGKPVGGFDSED